MILPEELLIEIFARLPTKSVMRFRAVSNSMCEITKEKFFADLHCRRLSTLPSKQAPLFFTSRGVGDGLSVIGFCLQEGGECGRKDPAVSSYVLPFRATNHNGWPHGRDFDFACSCNGLVCIRPEDGTKPVIVCNPITLEFATLPSCSSHGRGFGLGYGPSTKEYKIACLTYDDNCFQFSSPGKLMVCTLGRDAPWREAGRVPLFVINKPPVYADGQICWLLLDGNVETNHYLLLFYNVDDDQLRLTTWSLPGVASSRTNFDRMLLVELEGRVSLAFHDDAGVEIWMHRGGDVSRGWARRHKIQTSRPNKLPTRNYNLPRMIGIWEREEGLHIWFQDRTALLYGRKNANGGGEVEFFREYEAPDLGDDEPIWRSCPNYRPSLVSLRQCNCGTGAKSYASARWSEPPPKIPLPWGQLNL